MTASAYAGIGASTGGRYLDRSFFQKPGTYIVECDKLVNRLGQKEGSRTYNQPMHILEMSVVQVEQAVMEEGDGGHTTNVSHRAGDLVKVIEIMEGQIVQNPETGEYERKLTTRGQASLERCADFFSATLTGLQRMQDPEAYIGPSDLDEKMCSAFATADGSAVKGFRYRVKVVKQFNEKKGSSWTDYVWEFLSA